MLSKVKNKISKSNNNVNKQLNLSIVKEVSNVDVVKIGLFNLPVTLIVILITLLAIYVSLLKPMKMASGVSPIEAIRYQENNNFKKEKING